MRLVLGVSVTRLGLKHNVLGLQISRFGQFRNSKNDTARCRQRAGHTDPDYGDPVECGDRISTYVVAACSLQPLQILRPF